MNALPASVQTWLNGLAPRERRMVVWGSAITAVLIFVFALILPLYTAVSQAATRVAQKQQDLGWMRSVSGELRAAGPAVAGSDGGQSPVVIINQTAQNSGLGQSLTGSQPSGTGGIRVRLENAPFDTVVAWLGALEQQHHLTVESATVDRGQRTGVVNASFTFKKTG